MTPEDLRADIPVTERVAYLNTGASGPSSRRVVDAMTTFQKHHEFVAPAEEGMYAAARDAIEDARETVSAFLGADPYEVTFTESTTEGIAFVAWALPWEAGDTVVRTDVEHPAGMLPWKRLRDTHGIEVEVVECDRGRFDLEDFADAVSRTTPRVVCLSSVSWNFGTRLPVREVVDIAHEHDALVVVDAVQSFGQLPVDVGEWGADFVAASGHKWPLGPWGSGVLYVADRALDRLSPARMGGWGVEDSHAEHPAFKHEAAMFELSTRSAAVIRGFEEAVRTVEDVGLDAITDRIETLTDRLKAGVPDDRLLSPPEYETGLVSFEVADPEGFVERVREDDIVIRTLPYPEAVRASVHAFNTTAEIDALLEHV